MCTREVFACLTYHRRRHYDWLRKIWTFGATISSAVHSITAQIATLRESNYNNAPQDNAGEAIQYAIGTTPKRNYPRGLNYQITATKTRFYREWPGMGSDNAGYVAGSQQGRLR